MRLVNWRALVVGAAGFGLAACGDDVTVSPTPLAFTTSPASGATCVAGTSTAVGVTVTGGTGTPSVNFSAQNSLITVTGSGTSATVLCGATAGGSAVNFTITSGSQTATGSIPVTITPSSTGGSQVTAISVNPPSASLVPGTSITITAAVTLAPNAPAATSTAATFTSSDPTIATVTSNANGTATVTALATPANVGKQVVITAASVANPNLRAFTTITISPTSALVQSLQVSPPSVSLSTGGTQQITANVTLAAGAPAGTSTGVTYISSDTSIAKVSSTGLVTAGARNGVATITVASVAAPSVTQQVGVTVTAPLPVRLTIQSIEVVNAAGNLVPADPTNVTGNITVTLNLDPGTGFTPDSVAVTLGGSRKVCQRFSAQLAAALRASVQNGSADFAPIQCTLNTAEFNALSGAALVTNGAQPLTATVYYRPTGTTGAQTQTASIVQQLTLNNTSGFNLVVSNTPTATQVANSGNVSGQAVGPNGLLYRAGSITVTVLPVLFNRTGSATDSLQSINVTLVDPNIIANTAGFNNQPGGVTAPGARQANGTFVAVFAGASAALPTTGASGPLNGFTSSPSGTQIQINNVIGGNITGPVVLLSNQGVPLAGVPLTNSTTLFVDNQNPPVFAANGGAGVNGAEIQFPLSSQVTPTSAFVNGAFRFADSVQFVNSATVAFTNADNGGVDRVGRLFQFTAAPITSSSTFTTFTSGADVPPSNTSTFYNFRVRFVDALGNAANVTSTSTFGVDIVAPTFTSITGPAALSQNTAAQSLTYNGLTDNAAGINLAQALVVSASRLAVANNTVGGTTFIVACPLTATQPDSSTTLSRVCPAIGTGNPVSFTQNGYYTVTSQARDRANNLTAVDTRQFVIDNVAPTLTLQGGAPSLITRGQAVSFANFAASDNLDLIMSYGIVNFGGGQGAGGLSLAYNGPQLGTLFDNVLTTTATPVFTLPIATAQVENTLGNTQVISGFTGAVTDAGNNIGTASLAFGLGNFASAPASASFSSRGVQQLNLAVALGSGITQLSTGGTTTGTTIGRTASITVTAVGPSGTFVNPFGTVELRYLDPTLNAYRVFTVLTLSGQSDNGVSRTYTYTGTYAPSAANFLQPLPNPANVNLIAIGFAANGDALATAPTVVQLVP